MARRTNGEKAAEKTMGGGRKPSERPSKICVACGLPFSWRKKWERDWEGVKYCSDRCRTAGKAAGANA
jgi:hypothetical protein